VSLCGADTAIMFIIIIIIIIIFFSFLFFFFSLRFLFTITRTHARTQQHTRTRTDKRNLDKVLTGSRLCEKYTDNALQRTGIINNYYP
jgi:uncharacterized membrane protein YqiK